MAIAVGVDVGGTKIAAMRVDRAGEAGEILDRVQVATPPDSPEAQLAAIESAALSVIDPGVAAVGVGIAGLVEFATGIMRYGPNLPFRDLPLKARLEAATGLPCLVDNDATVAAWGEYCLGAGRGASDMLLVAVGTGIGGGIVAGGRVFRGAHGFGAEIGHIIVEPGGPLCGCGNRGCLEQVASGRAIDRVGREAAARNPESLLARLAREDPAKRVGLLVTEAARRGDPVALDVLAEVGRRLGEGIAGLVNVLDSDVVVVGGGVVEAGDMLLDPVRRAFQGAIEAPGHRPAVPIVPAQMGNDAGAVGAALLAVDELLGLRGASTSTGAAP